MWWKRNQGSSLSRRFPRQPDIDIDAGFKNSNDSRGFLIYKARHWEHPKMYPPKLMMMRMMIKMMITLPPRREGSMCFQQDRPQALVATRTPRTWRDLKIIGNFMSCAKPHSYLTRTISFLQVRKLNLDWFGASLLLPVELLLHYITGEPGWEGVLDYSSCDIINVTRRREEESSCARRSVSCGESVGH